MPELPEIETVKKTLSPLLVGQKIADIKIQRADIIKHPIADDFAQRVCGRKIVSLSRRGKYLCIHLDDGQMLVAHLRMTGRFICVPASHPLKPHTHVIFVLTNQSQLRFSDTRRFGCLWLLDKDEPDTVTGMQKLGVEPLTTDLTTEYVQSKLGKRRVAVKNGILDQSVIAGLGNIYADETLFTAKIHPERLCNTLSFEEWDAITRAIPPILEKSIENNGTTFSDFLDGEGNEGSNMPFLRAYGRYGQPCMSCGKPMCKTRVGGRGTCFCACCQK